MTMTGGTNKWASRAVVILQLAAWSAVGIVLLQKGVSSLQKGRGNITQGISNTAWSQSEKDISVISIVEDSKLSQIQNSNIWNVKSMAHKLEKLQHKSDSSNIDFNKKIDEPRDSKEIPEEKKLSNNKKDLFINKKTEKIKLTELDKYADKLKPLSNIKDASIKLILPGMNSSLERQSGMSESDEVYENLYFSQQPRNFSSPSEDIQKSNKTSTSTEKASIWEKRRRLRLSHLSGSGAAAAVAMVAVGAVMLVLGPAVIVLRALDERRQERRFLKLSARDDLPPTYEQATLMDEAPRYSSLNLNTIIAPPPV